MQSAGGGGGSCNPSGAFLWPPYPYGSLSPLSSSREGGLAALLAEGFPSSLEEVCSARDLPFHQHKTFFVRIRGVPWQYHSPAHIMSYFFCSWKTADAHPVPIKGWMRGCSALGVVLECRMHCLVMTILKYSLKRPVCKTPAGRSMILFQLFHLDFVKMKDNTA